MNIKYVKTSEVIPYKKNNKLHPDEQIDAIANQIRLYDFDQPIVIDDKGVILKGHGRWLAAKKLKLDKVPVIIRDDLTAREKQASRIGDNRVAKSDWDLPNLRIELGELDALNIDLPEWTGFTSEELEDIMVPEKHFETEKEDDVPNAPKEAKTVLGDIYTLGNHRLLCGDSTNIQHVEKLMDGKKADMVFTDPPYGVNFKQGKFIGRDKKGKNRGFSEIENDNLKGEELKSFIKEALSNAILVSEVCSIYVWSPPLLEGLMILKAIIESGYHVQSQMVWNKTPFVIGRADYHWKHEICWYGYYGKNHQWYGGRDKSKVWDVKKTRSSDIHPTMKPVQLAEIACNNSTKKGDHVLDLFGGSGSTLIACEKTNRKCYMMELDPIYCDVIVKRWENLTGKKAEFKKGPENSL